MFFVSLALTAVAPLTHLSLLYSAHAMFSFIRTHRICSNTPLPEANETVHNTGPVVPSLLSYVAGLFFYVTCLPECDVPKRWAAYLFYCGGGSHAIRHGFIMLAISQHRTAMASLAQGIEAVM